MSNRLGAGNNAPLTDDRDSSLLVWSAGQPLSSSLQVLRHRIDLILSFWVLVYVVDRRSHITVATYEGVRSLVILEPTGTRLASFPLLYRYLCLRQEPTGRHTYREITDTTVPHTGVYIHGLPEMTLFH